MSPLRVLKKLTLDPRLTSEVCDENLNILRKIDTYLHNNENINQGVRLYVSSNFILSIDDRYMQGVWRALEGSSREDIVEPLIQTLVYAINNDKIEAKEAVELCKSCLRNFRLVYGYDLKQLMHNLHIITFKCNQYLHEKELQKQKELEKQRKKELKEQSKELKKITFSKEVNNAIVYENTFALHSDPEEIDDDLDVVERRINCGKCFPSMKLCIII